MIVQDDRGQSFSTAPRQRVVSLVPSISETLWALGIGSRLVGVTRYCTDPSEVRSLPRCGGTKNPDLEKIADLAPDLVFMSEEENRLEDFEALRSRGIEVFISFPRRVDDVADWVRRVGAAVGAISPAEALAQRIETAVSSTRLAVAGRRRVRLFCPIWKKPWMSFNADTYTHSVLEACGGDNVFASAAERYCVVTLEQAAAAGAELVLLPDEPYPFAEKDLADLAPLLAPSGPARAAHVVDGQALSWYGVRTCIGLDVLQQAILGGHA